MEMGTEANLAKTVVLFDLDGVLIKSGGYRAAFHAAMKYFLANMGLNSEIGPKENDLVIFESYGVTAEWDMLSISLAIIFEHCYQLFNENINLFNIKQALAWVATHETKDIKVDYESVLNRLGPYYWSTAIPAESIWQACQNGYDDQLFPCLSRQPLFEQMLMNTRSAADSLTTRILQNYQLGDIVFEKAYRMPAEVKTKSILQINDSSLLSGTNRLELQRLFDQKGIYLAYLTLRPSYPPQGIDLDVTGYSPEAELALEKMDLINVPMMAYGRMQFLAGQLKSTTASLVKPYPYQALAGIKAALDGNELSALLWVGNIYRMKQPDFVGSKQNRIDSWELDLPEDLDIHIFEDMPVGIQSTRQAADILSEFGINVKLTAWGIAHDQMMETVLSAQGAQVYTDINQAVQEFFKLIHH
jgi:hypothetical protein